MASEKPTYQAIRIDEEKCIGCSHCVKICPTVAMRVWNGKAIIDENKCVDCGDCFRVCPVSAIFVSDTEFLQLSQDQINIALVPAVFLGQFNSSINRAKIQHAVKDIGFDYLIEVEESTGYLANEIGKYIQDDLERKYISSYCPAVIRLIQTRFPELISLIIPLKSPMEITAMHTRKKLQNIYGEQKKLVFHYVSPCASKSAAIKSEDHASASYIDHVISMDVFFNHVSQKLNTYPSDLKIKDFDDHLCTDNILWSLTGGESAQLSGRCLSIDGMNHIIEFLEKLDIDDSHQIDYLELKACDQGCAGGILNPENRFFCAESMKNRAAENSLKHNKEWDDSLLNPKNVKLDKIENLSVLALDREPAKALKMMNKTRRMMCYLPGFDCGACGAPTCKSLAEDVAKGDAILSHCVFMQRQMEKHHRLSPEHAFNIIESIWGKDRLDKDCNKKGAINDYS